MTKIYSELFEVKMVILWFCGDTHESNGGRRYFQITDSIIDKLNKTIGKTVND